MGVVAEGLVDVLLTDRPHVDRGAEVVFAVTGASRALGRRGEAHLLFTLVEQRLLVLDGAVGGEDGDLGYAGIEDAVAHAG